MTRETRLIVVLAVVALAGVGSLAFMANQYKKRLPASLAGVPETPARRAARQLDGFLAARAAVQGVAAQRGAKLKAVASAVTGGSQDVAGDGIGPGLDVIADYRNERLNAFTAHRMTLDDYAATRAAWRAWRDSKPAADAALAEELERRRDDAGRADLGELEAFDDAIN
jgi:hypothetical protein